MLRGKYWDSRVKHEPFTAGWRVPEVRAVRALMLWELRCRRKEGLGFGVYTLKR